ncbi:hypothetical protein PISMIDRAFT_6908 [Pisolithus microcarpus 441]|uniref:Uncharacterized protein n=1 Tax=Pisolithus microcarpus 441 TaxID=765257 RepID=A0A0C9ZK32_9AGAM|nr:hypothetical protein BKA83DRAFT_6908 [Pisolithus microcarpus]KIK29661.1 hypothetical protein PISMIDRAFT_6908 [Pisolithus microcarpus 441]
MSPNNRTRRRAFKWPARDDTPPRRRSFSYSQSPSRSRSRDAKRRRECLVSPPHRQWHASEFGMVVHDDCGWLDGCSACSQYMLHMAQDLVLGTPDLVHARSDCVHVLSQLLGLDNALTLRCEVDRLRADQDYWWTHAHHYQDECERLEEDHDFDRARAASLASQPRHNCPPQPAGAGPSSSSLVARLSGGGRGEAPAMYHQSPRTPPRLATTPPIAPPAPRGEPHEMLNTNTNKPMETQPHLKCPLLTDRLKEARTMFPYLHIQVQQNLYQFEAPLCDDMERAISAGYAPALFGAVPPGVAHLLNTPREIDEVYARAAREDDEGRAHNAKAAQRLITWINRYLADVDWHTRKKPAKNPVAAYALSQWHPPAWMAAKGKSKHENYKPSVTGLAPQPPPAYEEHQAGPIEAREEPIITCEPNPAPQVERIPPVVELPTPVAVAIQVTTPTVPVVPPVIDRWDHKKRWHQDRGPKVALHWGAPLSQWREHVQKYLDVEETSHFLGVLGPLEELAEDKEAALVRQIRGFILEGYFAPRFRYDSNCHGAKGTWDTPKDVAPSPADIARYLARNRLSFQEADDLYSWGVSFLQDESDALQEKGQQCHDGLTRGNYLQGTPEDRIADQRPLEYYLECTQELGLSDFWDVEPIPTNVNSLSGVEVVGGVITATDCDDNWDLDAPTASNVQQMDVDDSGPAPM